MQLTKTQLGYISGSTLTASMLIFTTNLDYFRCCCCRQHMQW